MTVRKNFDIRYVNNQLKQVSEKLTKKTTIYVTGGTVMAVENLKEGTKDIDIGGLTPVHAVNVLPAQVMGYARKA